jgi:hypothetical protein
MKKQIVQMMLASLISLSLLTEACGVDSNNPIEADTEIITMPAENSEVGMNETTDAEKISILPEEITYYEGAEHMDVIGVTGKPANFKRDRNLPYGFYIFETMEEYVLEDGTEWGMDKQKSLFSLFKKEQVPFESNYTNPLLSKYKEYAGTEKNETGSYYDFFNINDRGHELVIRLHYFEEDIETTLPMFLDIISNIKYIPDPKAFQPGVDFEFPKGVDEDEEAIIQLVKKNIEAIVNKDKAAFMATLEPQAYDYLGFLIDTKRQYRFTKLVIIEPSDDSNWRRGINISFDYLEEDMVKQSGHTFTSRKDKDGKWKIANID